MGSNHACDVVDNLRGRAGQAALRGVRHGTAPTSLIEAVDEDAVRCELSQQFVVPICMITKPVDEDDGRNGGAGRLF